MAGLLSQTPASAGGASPPPQAGAPPAEEGEPQPNVTPEEQAELDRFVDKAFELIYDDAVQPKILKRLGGEGNPVDGLAATTAMVVKRVEDSAEKAGQPVSPDILFHGGKQILEDLAELSERAGIYEYDQEELDGAGLRALDLYRDAKAKSGTLDEGAIKQDFDAVVQADQQGQLGQMFPGLEEFGGGQAGGA